LQLRGIKSLAFDFVLYAFISFIVYSFEELISSEYYIIKLHEYSKSHELIEILFLPLALSKFSLPHKFPYTPNFKKLFLAFV